MLTFSVAILAISITACGAAQQNNIAQPNQTTNSSENNKTESPISQEPSPAVLYTADEGGSITKIDAASNQVLQIIQVEGAVHNVQVSPDGKWVGATVVPSMSDMEGMSETGDQEGEHGEDGEHEMNGYAYFYDTATDELMKKVEVGAHPAHIVFTMDGNLVLITNNEGNNVSVLDAKTFQMKGTIPTGKSPHGFRGSADSKLAYVANMGEDTVSVLNLQMMSEERKIKVGSTPVTTGITSDGKTLVVPLNAENAVAIVDLATEEVIKVPVGTGPAQVYISSDNKNAIVANQGTEQNPSNNISKIDLATKQVIATIETGKGAHGVVVSPDNRNIYVTNMFDNTVTVIDNETNKVITTIKVGTTPNGISVTP
ncbi:YncE family protein [Paenibacillus timonensis]|uniref:YncE family protein n=1 Tax=Paenibacillus timonensis TaxID=225915 RepID=UPI003F97A09C